ncbi:MAG: alpha/beta fold hydrolase [Gemmatales bacterium]|nr:lysophospholipase [Gemmatales bacterium]MCS7160982.1 lysophospholipase [Gemmatales bacterium]MDW8176185.1 alpha/beta fold hydrolase [Gemmatales bacterium]MDW8221348.1 alpha/beta fold hydrolase [Gemmatales bacterium]
MTSSSPQLLIWSASDGYKGYYRLWLPSRPALANVVCLHGIQSHSGWYDYSSARLCEAGYIVWFPDRRGSGRNWEQRGDCPSYRRLLADVAEIIASIRAGMYAARIPGRGPGVDLPVILLAGSWGAKLAVACCRAFPGCADALILWSPGFFPQVRLSWRDRWRVLLARLLEPRRLFPIPLNDPNLFTANPERIRFIEEDELALRQATARFLVESRRLDWYVRGAAKHVTCPVLLLLAGKDRIIDNQKTRQFFERFASSHKTVQEYPDAHHTLEFEKEPDFFLQDILDWLAQIQPRLQRRESSFQPAWPAL